MHRPLATALAAAALLTLVACGGDADSAAAPDPTVSPSSLFTDGTWQRVVTAAEAEAAGLGPADVTELLGADGQTVVEIEIEGDRWKQYQTADDGSRELGDLGTWSVDEDGSWVTVSESPGCRGCTTVMDLTGTAERVTTELPASVSDPVARLILEGTWERTA